MKKNQKINKSAWIRAQPKTLSAKDTIAKAKKEGFTLTAAQVYTARSTGEPTGKRGRPLGSGKGTVIGELTDTQRQFLALAVRIGTDEAQRLLAAAASGQLLPVVNAPATTSKVMANGVTPAVGQA